MVTVVLNPTIKRSRRQHTKDSKGSLSGTEKVSPLLCVSYIFSPFSPDSPSKSVSSSHSKIPTIFSKEWEGDGK